MSRFGRAAVSFLALLFLVGGPTSRARAGNRSADSDLRSSVAFDYEAQWALNKGNAPEDQSIAGLPTPELIEAAQRRNEIDQDTAALFIAFALGEYEGLPDQYRSNVPWDGTLPLLQFRRFMQDFWELSSKGASRSLLALNSALTTTS